MKKSGCLQFFGLATIYLIVMIFAPMPISIIMFLGICVFLMWLFFFPFL